MVARAFVAGGVPDKCSTEAQPAARYREISRAFCTHSTALPPSAQPDSQRQMFPFGPITSAEAALHLSRYNIRRGVEIAFPKLSAQTRCRLPALPRIPPVTTNRPNVQTFPP